MEDSGHVNRPKTCKNREWKHTSFPYFRYPVKSLRFYLWLLLLFLAPFLRAQEFSYLRYDVEKGLPSSELYDVVQDRQGFIWIASDRGVSRFDGYTFTNFTMNDGLTDNTVFNIWPDEKGRLWFNAFNCRLCYYENGIFHEYQWNDTILRYTRGNKSLRSFHAFPDGSLLLGYLNLGVIRISPAGKTSWELRDKTDQFVAFRESGALIAGSNRQVSAVHTAEKIFSYRLGATQGSVVLGDSIISYFLAFERSNGNSCFAFQGLYVEISPDGTVSRSVFDSDIVRISEDHDSCIWVSCRKGGVERFAPNRVPSPGAGQRYLPGDIISCVYEDSEGGFWFSTLKNGLLYTPSLAYRLWTVQAGEPEQWVISITGSAGSRNDLLFIGMKNGQIHERVNGAWKISDAALGADPGLANLKSIFYDSAKAELYAGFSTSPLTVVMGRDGKTRTIASYANGYAVRGDTVILQLASSIMYYSRSGVAGRNVVVPRPEQICMDRSGNLWVAGRGGLYIESGSSIVPVDSSNQLLRLKMLCLKLMPDGQLVMGTIGKGLIVYDPRTGKTQALTESDGLAGNIVNAIAIGPDSSVWAATHSGLSQVRFSGGKPGRIINYTHSRGLPSNEIRTMYATENEIWLGTRKGPVVFYPEKVRKNVFPPPVYFTGVVAGDSALAPGRSAELPYDKNMLRFSFVGLNYRSRGQVNYRYHLEGMEGGDGFTRIPEAQFLSVPPGTYHFKVWAINEDGIESKEPAVFTFVIRPPFWETYWFRLLALVLILLAAGGLVYGIILRIRQKNRLREKLLEYQQQALSNQMNPHFIFNSLNAVQSYILREDKLTATKYLSRFSKLMRMSLDHSRMKMVPLAQEISLIRVYLELEAMRFGERLDWAVEVSPELDTAPFLVPSMLIQPYLENAIRHGILNREDKSGKIRVRFIREGDMIRCEVEDNGVGREAAAARNDTSTHRSAGTSITANRLRLICRSLGVPFRLDITDLRDEAGKPSGTIVIFTLPYLKNSSEN